MYQKICGTLHYVRVRQTGWLQEDQGKVHAVNALAAGTVAGIVESATCLTPLQNIQIKMMQMDRYDSCYDSLMSCSEYSTGRQPRMDIKGTTTIHCHLARKEGTE